MNDRTLISPRRGRSLIALLLGGVLCAGCSSSQTAPKVVDPVADHVEQGKRAYAKAFTNGKITSAQDLDQALAELTTALSYNSRFPEAYYLRGKVFTALGLYELAGEDFTKAIAFQPRYPEAYLARAEVHCQLKLFTRAIFDAKEAVRQDPQKGLAYAVLGKAYFYADLPDYLEAKNCFLVAQRLDKNFDAKDLIHQAEEKLQPPPAPEKQASPSLWKPKQPGGKSGPTPADPRVEKLLSEARSLAANGELPRAMARFREAEQIDPDAAEVYFERGSALLDHGSAYTAIREFDEALRCRRDYADALMKRSLAHLRVDRCFAAVSDATGALRLKPDSAEAYTYRAEALLRQRNFAPAVDDFREALRWDPSRQRVLLPLLSEARRGLGETFLRNRQWAKARWVFEEAWTSDPQERSRLRPLLAETYRGLGKASSRDQDYSQADSFLRAAEKIDPDDPKNVELLGLTLYKKGNYAEALSCFRRAVRLDPDRQYLLERYIQTANQRSAGDPLSSMVAKPVVE